MRRRDFIRNSLSALSIPLIFQGQTLGVIGDNLLLKSLMANKNRKLVLLQLDGGNDGLNMFYPVTQYDNLQKARPNIIIPRNKLLDLTDALSLHPSMINFKRMYEDEQAQIIQNVGYPAPNLSHFRSKDIITSGSSAEEIIRSGWMGRYLQDLYPDFPTDYPNSVTPHPVAITIGSSSSPTCQGEGNNFSIVLKDLDSSYLQPGQEPAEYPDTPYGHELKFITETMAATEAYLDTVKAAASSATNLSPLYPQSSNKLADQLAMVARLIAGGLQTQLYIVNLGGFDTHANQVTSTDEPETGKHADLLKQVADALRAFVDDLVRLEKNEEVIGLVYTEFGRRIKSNDQLGTDHGTAFPAILFGTPVNPLTLGQVPQIPDEVDATQNLEMEIDIRSVYASIFKEWFQAEDGAISQLLYDDFEILPILKSSKDSPFYGNEQMKVTIFPNPATDYIKVDVYNEKPHLEITLFNEAGQKVHVFFDQEVIGNHQLIRLPLDAFPRGYYIIQVRSEEKSVSQKIVLTD